VEERWKKGFPWESTRERWSFFFPISQFLGKQATELLATLSAYGFPMLLCCSLHCKGCEL
jgi:hypothetical protein